jgi:hypothetical protein
VAGAVAAAHPAARALTVGPPQLLLHDAPPGIVNLGDSCFLAAALQALGGPDGIWEEAAWSEAWAHGAHTALARELWDIIGELRGSGGHGPIRLERLLALLREGAQAFARPGAHDAMEMLGSACGPCRTSRSNPGDLQAHLRVPGSSLGLWV